VFNNIFVQTGRVPGVGFAGIKDAGKVREGGNMLWGIKDGPALKGDPFAKFRASALFKDSRRHYEPGWTTHDRVADPKFMSFPIEEKPAADLRLKSDSPAVNAGLKLPTDWPDPLRESDTDAPDIGAMPLSFKPWGVGVDGRIPLFGETVHLGNR
jgi:hypothetical protein